MPVANTRLRIQSIQSKLAVPQTGIFDLATCLEVEKLARYSLSIDYNLTTHIKILQTFLRCEADGVMGSETFTKLENYLSTKLPQLPSGTSMRISKRSLVMLIGFEVSSESVYNSKYQHPIWPGGESGITIGIGFDLGFNTPSSINEALNGLIDDKYINILSSVAGLTANAAKNALPRCQEVIIDYNTALNIFHQTTLPSFARRTKKTYPGIEKLPPDAQGALLSLVYNRGESVSGNARIEMKNIIAYVGTQNLAAIAKEIRKMKRLWEGKGLPGLLERREKEADLVEKATFNLLQEDIIVL